MHKNITANNQSFQPRTWSILRLYHVITEFDYCFWQSPKQYFSFWVYKSLSTQHELGNLKLPWKLDRLWAEHNKCNTRCWYWVIISAPDVSVYWLGLKQTGSLPFIFCQLLVMKYWRSTGSIIAFHSHYSAEPYRYTRHTTLMPLNRDFQGHQLCSELIS